MIAQSHTNSNLAVAPHDVERDDRGCGLKPRPHQRRGFGRHTNSADGSARGGGPCRSVSWDVQCAPAESRRGTECRGVRSISSAHAANKRIGAMAVITIEIWNKTGATL